MNMTKHDLELNAYFTTNGEDIWRIQSYCLEPTCLLRNLETGKEESFGMGGITANSFKRISMPIVNK